LWGRKTALLIETQLIAVVNTHAQTVLQQAWLTCQQHWHNMQHALQALPPHLPVLGQDLTNLYYE
jgi:hypothetical protein